MQWQTILIPALSTIILFSLFYGIARLRDDYSIIDVCWGLGFVVIAGTNISLHGGFTDLTHGIIFLLVTLWALRLSGYILYRNLKKGEDSRYKAWRDEWGDKAPLNFFIRVYLLQALLCMMVASGLWLTLAQKTILWNYLSLIGLIISLFAFCYEAIADYQKDQFKKDPKNQGLPCREGLWYYSRHPNYFGEMLFWWGLFFFSLNTPFWYLAWIGPALIVFFLIKVSGIPMIKAAHEKNPKYKDYLNSTNALIPWPPKKDSP